MTVPNRIPKAAGTSAGTVGWYLVFFGLALASFVAIGYLAGVDAIAGSARFAARSLLLAWNAASVAGGGLLKAIAGMAAPIVKSLGWRRLSRISTSILSIGLVYSSSVVLSDGGVRRAKGWLGRIRTLVMVLRERWLELHIAWKLAIVAALIAGQIYLHWLLILFPIAFLVPVIRKLWVQAADLVLGNWYWRKFGRRHRSVIRVLSALFGVKQIAGAARMLRMRYLCAWRLWKYHPRYRRPDNGRRVISLIEPLRLWRRAELDLYVGRPLLGGSARRWSTADRA